MANYVIYGSDGSKRKYDSELEALEDRLSLEQDNIERMFSKSFPQYKPVEYTVGEENPWEAALDAAFPGANPSLGSFGLDYPLVSPEQMGTGYATIDEAGKAAIRAINDYSVSREREYSGEIYKIGDLYYYSQARLGGKHESAPPMFRPRGELVATYHTHGASDEGADESFSWQDLDAIQAQGLPAFLGTPQNSRGVQKYVPEKLLGPFEGVKYWPKTGLSPDSTGSLEPTEEFVEYLLNNGTVYFEKPMDEWPEVEVR
jgi:hypothetical protein